MNTVSLNGVEVFPFCSEDQLLRYVDTHKGILVALNAEKVIRATDQMREIINGNIGYCDGIGVVWALKRKGHKEVCKIPGCELWLSIVRSFYKTKSFYFVGGRPLVIEQTIERLKCDFPGIHIVNYRDGYLKTELEKATLIADIAEKKPDVVFVAMGSPKQEFLMEEMEKVHPAIYQGLGGSFDVYTGYVERAPEWWLEHNMEFVYRIFRQPKKLIRVMFLLKCLVVLLFRKK